MQSLDVILLADLDNTLVDRDQAFRSWASGFVEELGGSAEDLRWLLTKDAGGYQPRALLADAIRHRFHLKASAAELVDRLLYEHVEFTEPYEGVLAQLQSLTGIGACVVVVTNGTVRQQEMKLRRTGLLDLIAGAVISEAVGVKKPDSRIFAAATGAVKGDRRTGSVWMIGDHVTADIAGARACGFRTGWVSHGRRWTESWAPDLVGHCTVDLLDQVRDLLSR